MARRLQQSGAMAYYNFARHGYAVLNPLLAGHCWPLLEGEPNAIMTFEVETTRCDPGRIHFSRPRGAADRVQAATGEIIRGVNPTTDPYGVTKTRGPAIVALLTLLVAYANIGNPAPVTRSEFIYGLGFTGGDHGGDVDERYYDRFPDAMRARGQGWIADYRDLLSCGPFFNTSDRWWEWGAIASRHGVMKLRLESGARLLEIEGYAFDTYGNIRIFSGITQEQGTRLEAR